MIKVYSKRKQNFMHPKPGKVSVFWCGENMRVYDAIKDSLVKNDLLITDEKIFYENKYLVFR